MGSFRSELERSLPKRKIWAAVAVPKAYQDIQGGTPSTPSRHDPAVVPKSRVESMNVYIV